jgi:hypothetical protein
MKCSQILCKFSTHNEIWDLCLQLPYEHSDYTLPSLPAVSVTIALENLLNLINTEQSFSKTRQISTYYTDENTMPDIYVYEVPFAVREKD